MTSHKKSSGFEFWSRVICAWPWCICPPNFAQIALYPIRFRLLVSWSSPHGRGTSSHKRWCRYLYQVQSYWHFSEIQDGGRRHLGFSVFYEFGHSGVLIVWYLFSVSNLVQIYLIVSSLRSTHICFRHSFDDVTRINFRFRLLIIWSSPHGRDAYSHIIWCKMSLSSPKLLTFFRNSRWRSPPSFKMTFAAILDFQFTWIWPFLPCWQCGICVLYQIWFKYLL